jgi:PAS domain S-box-containing protein
MDTYGDPARRSQDLGRSFQQVVSKMNLFALTLDGDAKLSFCNDYFLALTGWTLPEVLGCDWFERFVPHEAPELRELFADILNDSPSAWHHENEIRCRSGEMLLVRWNNSVIRDTSGEPVGVASIGENITERRILESKLLDVGRRERRRLSADIHDGLGQTLYGASLLINNLEKSARSSGAPIATDLTDLASIIGSSIETCRQIAQGLSPLSDTSGGIIGALRTLVDRPTHSQTSVTLEVTDTATLRLDNTTADHLYRIAQEALTNALKHASATRITVRLNVRAGSVTLTVTDDGIGLAKPRPNSRGLGLKLMQYRADLIGATLAIARQEPHGTRVSASVRNRPSWHFSVGGST